MALKGHIDFLLVLYAGRRSAAQPEVYPWTENKLE